MISIEMATNSATTDKVLSPASFAHVVLRTTSENFPKVTEFYKTFLGAEANYENDFVSFLSYDEEHHRIALIGMPNTGSKQQETCGLDHFAFSYKSLQDLAQSYKQRKALNILPHWCINHGPTTSIYYRDPDGNKIEIQVDNMDREGTNEFIRSKAFAENPIGVEFDPEDLIARLEAGEDEAQIKKRPDIGPRGADMDSL